MIFSIDALFAVYNILVVGSQLPEDPKNVNFEPIIRGLKNDNFDWNQV